MVLQGVCTVVPTFAMAAPPRSRAHLVVVCVEVAAWLALFMHGWRKRHAWWLNAWRAVRLRSGAWEERDDACEVVRPITKRLLTLGASLLKKLEHALPIDERRVGRHTLRTAQRGHSVAELPVIPHPIRRDNDDARLRAMLRAELLEVVYDHVRPPSDAVGLCASNARQQRRRAPASVWLRLRGARCGGARCGGARCVVRCGACCGA